MVAILEPFIDTIVICTVTGLVLLSSGVWNKKYVNDFQESDLMIFDQSLSEDRPEDVEEVRKSFISSWSQNQTSSRHACFGSTALGRYRAGLAGFALYSAVDCHHQGWHSGPSLCQNSAYEIVAI